LSHGGKGDLCVELITLPLSCADCLEILGASTSWSPTGLYRSIVQGKPVFSHMSGYQETVPWVHKPAAIPNWRQVFGTRLQNILVSFWLLNW
jgi:hypothetical protein